MKSTATEWSPEEEAARLKARFKASGIKQAQFAREFGIKGGDSMVSQHIHARRPINMESAIAYARGFGVPLSEISPRLAAQTTKATKVMSGSPEEAPAQDQLETDGDFELSTEREWRLFRAHQLIAQLSPEEELAMIEEAERRAALLVGNEYLKGRMGVKGYAPDEKVSKTIKAAPRHKKGSEE